MKEDIKILYVDDELNNLISFKASLRNKYKIFLAENISNAYEILRKHPDIRMVFSDQHMPEGTGTAFFETLRIEFPQAIRILVTGYTRDLDAVVEGINRGNVYRYMKKPWKTDVLLRIIAESNQYYLASSLLAEKNRELEKAYAELDKFAHSVSHDIRGPLAGIMSAAQLAKDIDNPEESQEILTIIGHSAERLDRYILNVHDYYSVRRGEFSISEIDFGGLSNDLLEMYEASASSKEVKFLIKLNIKEAFRSDETGLRLILTNLISNAFKYQKHRGQERLVEVIIEVNKGIATFLVKDTGIGIKEHYFSEIFNIFFRASLDEPGSGLGLYNVKSMVNKLGGSISVESEYSVGSIFKVELPSK